MSTYSIVRYFSDSKTAVVSIGGHSYPVMNKDQLWDIVANGKLPERHYQVPVNETKFETVEDFLARGGTITQCKSVYLSATERRAEAIQEAESALADMDLS